MIKIVGSRLIIPQGDTASFVIKLIDEAAAGNVAVFSILDPLTETNIFEKIFELEEGDSVLLVTLDHNDTVNIMPGKYRWDIKTYTDPQYDEDGDLIDGEIVNSYYGTYKLPICEIRRVPKHEQQRLNP